MKKNRILLVLELITFLILYLLGVCYVFTLGYQLSNFNFSSMSNSIQEIFIHQSIIFLIPFIIVLILFSMIKRTQKKNKITGITERLKQYLNKHKWLFLGFRIAILLMIISSLVLVIQDKVLYYPSHNEYGEVRLEFSNQYTKIEITKDELTYSGWGKISDELNKPTILFFGGNGDNSSSMFEYYHLHGWGYLDDYNFIMIDYPGYGLSDGEPGEDSIFVMSLIVFDYLEEFNVNQEDLIVMGFSLGTGVAMYVAENREFDKLILLAPYSSITDVFNTKLPIFYGPFKYLNRNEFNSESRIEYIDEKVLLIASETDEIIPTKVSLKLINAFSDKEHLIIEESQHNSLWSNTEVISRIQEFLSE